MTGRPKRSLGQNFLVDGNLQRKIVAALGAGPEDRVLEIGPGRGALTDHLQGRVGHLTLVELDDALARRLGETYAGRPDVDVVHDDILRVPLAERVADPASLLVLGNIPYNITTPILFHLLERPRPGRIVLMVQAEVAERLVAGAGDRAYGALSVGVAAAARARVLFRVPRTAFRPRPDVDSSVVELVPHDPPPLGERDERRLRALTRAVFQWRRKQIGKTLRDHPDLGLTRAGAEAALRAVGVDPTRRPETLSPDILAALAVKVVPEGPTDASVVAGRRPAR